jgi:RNA polymerase sigma-70 factor (ECF subfamily)
MDAELVAVVAAGDTAALAELYERHANAIYRAAFRRVGDRQIAEEVLQDTYMALWHRADLFDPHAGSLLAWLSTIARNRAVDRLRQLGRRPATVPLSAMLGDEDQDDRGVDRALASGTLMGTGSAPLDPERLLEDAALRQEIRAAMEGIPTLERQVLELAYYGGLTQSEISQRLGWPLGTVKTRTRRALLRLREVLSVVLGPDTLAPPARQHVAGSQPAPERPVLITHEVPDGSR